MAKHFEHRIIAAGHWRRCDSQGNGMKGKTDEDRPHFVPVTEQARTYMKASLFLGGTGLCPGQVDLEDEDVCVYAYRFIKLPDDPEQIDQMLTDLDDEVAQYVAAVA